MPMEDLVKQVAISLEREGSAHAVFGDVMKLEHHTIVPVAVVMGGGGGGGARPRDVGTSTSVGFAGGIGLALNVRPVGFIYERGEDVVFTPIHLDVRNRPLWTEAADGLRRAIDLATAYATQFMHRKTAEKGAAGAPEEVTSPS